MSANSGRIPKELYLGTILDVYHLRIFGSIAYVHVPKRKKFDSKSRKCFFLGYDDNSKI
jgi:hypothetical protein